MMELKPCPFCGSDAEFDVCVTDSPVRKMNGVALCYVGVKCKKCYLASYEPPTNHVPIEEVDSYMEKQKIKAAEIWNRRA